MPLLRCNRRRQIVRGQLTTRDEWNALEERWARVQGEIKRTASDSEATVKEMGDSVRALLDDLKGGYERIKTQLKESAAKN